MTGVPLKIREATLQDAKTVSQLAARTFADSFGADNRPDDMQAFLAENFSLNTIEAELQAPDNTYLLALEGDAVVGYAMLRKGSVPEAVGAERTIELARIYLEQASIGRGYGSTLMQACLERAAAEGYASIWLGVWERNARAIAFYEKWGFAIVGSHKFILGSDVQNDYVMERAMDGGR